MTVMEGIIQNLIASYPDKNWIVDIKNSSLAYLGETYADISKTSDPVWNVYRISKLGSQYEINNNNSLKHKTVWADRESLFSELDLDNVYSINFDGVDGYLNGGDIFQFDIATAFSISMWVKPQNIASTQFLFSKAGGGSVYGWRLRAEPTTGLLFLQMRTAATLRQNTYNLAVTAGVWNHVVFTYSGGSNISGAHVYVNGVKSTTPASGSLSGTMLGGYSFVIGQSLSAFYWSGKKDQISVWDKELSQSDVTTLYGAGTPVDPRFSMATTNLQAYYPAGDGDTYPTISDVWNSNDLTMTNMVSGDIVADVP